MITGETIRHTSSEPMYLGANVALNAVSLLDKGCSRLHIVSTFGLHSQWRKL